MPVCTREWIYHPRRTYMCRQSNFFKMLYKCWWLQRKQRQDTLEWMKKTEKWKRNEIKEEQPSKFCGNSCFKSKLLLNSMYERTTCTYICECRRISAREYAFLLLNSNNRINVKFFFILFLFFFYIYVWLQERKLRRISLSSSSFIVMSCVCCVMCWKLINTFIYLYYYCYLPFRWEESATEKN